MIKTVLFIIFLIIGSIVAFYFGFRKESRRR